MTLRKVGRRPLRTATTPGNTPSGNSHEVQGRSYGTTAPAVCPASRSFQTVIDALGFTLFGVVCAALMLMACGALWVVAP